LHLFEEYRAAFGEDDGALFEFAFEFDRAVLTAREGDVRGLLGEGMNRVDT